MFNSFTLMLTTRCNDWCEICDIGPLEENSTLPLNEALDYIDQAAPFVTRLYEHRLEILGGEPFNIFNSLLDVIRHATALGFRVEVSTNGFWATDKRKTKITITQLRDAGLRNLVIITDNYHLKFVSVDNIQNLITALREAGFLVSLIFRVSRFDAIPPELLALDGINVGIADIIVEPWLPISYQDPPPSNIFAVNSGFPPPVPCRLKLRLIVTPAGDVFPCMVGTFIRSFRMGNLKQEPLSVIMERMQSSTLLQRLQEVGPAGLLSTADRRSIEETLSNLYAENCWLCHKIFTYPALADIALRIKQQMR